MLVRLAAGDYAVGAGALVERKTVRGLHASIVEGRFWAQVGRLRASGARAYLLIEGRDLDDGPLHPNAIRGACVAALELQVGLIRTIGPADSARWLHRLAERRHRTAGRERPSYTQRPAPEPGTEAEGMLAALPGIGGHYAKAILTRFGSVEAVVAASDDDLCAIPGIGPARLRALRAALTGHSA